MSIPRNCGVTTLLQVHTEKDCHYIVQCMEKILLSNQKRYFQVTSMGFTDLPFFANGCHLLWIKNHLAYAGNNVYSSIKVYLIDGLAIHLYWGRLKERWFVCMEMKVSLLVLHLLWIIFCYEQCPHHIV